MKYAIFAGLSGGFGGATFQYVDEFDNEDEALKVAYDKAVAVYESYEGYESYHGLLDWEGVRDNLRRLFGEEPGEDDVRERYLEEVESWIDYRVEEYEEGKDYE